MFQVMYASGRSRCKICGEYIKKDDLQIVASSYHVRQCCHLSCISKEALRQINLKKGVKHEK